MLAANNEHITSAARSMYKKELDEATLRLCRKTDEEIAGEEYRIKRLAQLEAENAEQANTINNQTATINNQASTIDNQAATINDQAATINDQASIIEQLKKELALLKGE